MTLALRANSTVPTGTGAGTSNSTTLTVPLPTSCSDSDLLILAVWLKPETATITTPVGWTDVSNGEAAGGGGTTGADTGPTRLKLMYRQGLPPGSQSVTLATSPNSSMGMMFAVSSTVTDASYSVAGANGIDTTTGTPFTAAMNVDPGLTTNDFVLVCGGIPTDVTTPAQFSSETLTASGLTSGAVTEVAEPETTQGNDLGGVVCYWIPTGGPSSGVATFSATAGGTTTNVRGPICLVRVREVAAAAQPPVLVQQLAAA